MCEFRALFVFEYEAGRSLFVGGTGREAAISSVIFIFISPGSLHDRQSSVFIFIQSISGLASSLLFLYGCHFCRVLLLFW